MPVNNAGTVNLGGMDIICRQILPNSTSVSGTGFKMLGVSGNGVAPSSVTTTSSTYSAANMLGGVIVNSAASAVTATLDTAALVVAAINTASAGAVIGDLITFTVINGGNTSGAITVGAGTGGTFDANVPAANKVIAINTSRTVFVRLTNVTPGAEAYVIYM